MSCRGKVWHRCYGIPAGTSKHQDGYYSPDVTVHEPIPPELEDDWTVDFARAGAELGLHTYLMEDPL